MQRAPLETLYEHIEIDTNGVPYILGTKMKVIELVLGKISHGWSPEELHFQHPYLTMGQIHSALAYYWDHQSELEKDIELRLKKIKKIEEDIARSSFVDRLKSQGLV